MTEISLRGEHLVGGRGLEPLPPASTLLLKGGGRLPPFRRYFHKSLVPDIPSCLLIIYNSINEFYGSVINSTYNFIEHN